MQFGKKATAAIMASLLMVSTAPITTALAETAQQTGTGQTDLNMMLDIGTNVYGGTNDPLNPDADNDGLGDNIAFTVPSAINYVVKANGQLVGPNTGTAHIDNESVFPIEVNRVKFDAANDFNIVEDAAQSTRNNAVDIQIGPEQDMLQLSEHKDFAKLVNNPEAWEISAKDTGNTSKVPLASTGDVANITADITSNTKFGSIHWYVTPTHTLTTGLTVNYELLNHTTNQTITGQKILYKIHAHENPIEDIITDKPIEYGDELYRIEYNEATYSGTNWSDMINIQSQESTPQYLNLEELDGKTITLKGDFYEKTKQIYDQGLTINYSITDTRTNQTTQGTKTLYEINPSHHPLDDITENGSEIYRPRTILTYNNTEYEVYNWSRIYRYIDPGDGHLPDIEYLDISTLDGKTINLNITYASATPNITYTQGVHVQYTLTDTRTNETRNGETTLYQINPDTTILYQIKTGYVGGDPGLFGTLDTFNDANVTYNNQTYTGYKWSDLNIDLAELEGQNIIVTGTYYSDSVV